MTAKIIFRDPPPDGRGQDTHADEIASALRARPNEWALVKSKSSAAYSTKIRKGLTKAFEPAGSFESTTRRTPDGKFDIYARYVGGIA